MRPKSLMTLLTVDTHDHYKNIYKNFFAADSQTAMQIMYLCNSKSIVRRAPFWLRETRPQS